MAKGAGPGVQQAAGRTPVVRLAPGRERSLAEGHPWVFSGAVAAVEGAPPPGATVEVRAAGGALLARGAWSPASQIAVRVWTFDPGEQVSEGLFRRRLERAVRARGARVTAEGAACRLVHAESDGLPGLVVDRYAGWLVCQLTAAGVEHWKDLLVETLAALVPCEGIFERSEADVRRKEGLEPRTGVLRGAEPPDRIEIREGPCRFLVDMRAGHKTGFYLDQAENRAEVAAHAAGAEVLNAFAYTGAFAVAALHGGAVRTTDVEASASAIEEGQRHVALNGFDAARAEHVRGNVFEVLREWRDAGRRFDAVVLDPPRFAESKRQVERACRGYKDVNLLGLKLLRPGGRLFTFSCSSHVDAWLFERVVAGAAVDARRDVQILRRLGPPPDHPVSVTFPEGAYLKGLHCRVW
jgi:23S rRNA (cytosine1962-C5)-methyltransferase